MLRTGVILLLAGSCACGGRARPSLPLPELAPRKPWDDLERVCARFDDPPHLERMFVGEKQRERLVVPVGIEPALGISRSWLALGGQDPGLTPFEWSWLLPELDESEARHTVLVGTELLSPHALQLSVRPQIHAVSGWVVDVLVERRSSGELVGTLQGAWFTDIPPFNGHWDDLTGALRVSTPAWQAPGRTVAVHLELSSATAAMCGQLLIEVPPQGQPRDMLIPTVLTRPWSHGEREQGGERPSPRYTSSVDARP